MNDAYKYNYGILLLKVLEEYWLYNDDRYCFLHLCR